MARIFAYIVHKAGVADDSAAELAAAAKKIDAAAVAHGHRPRLGRRTRCCLRNPRALPTVRFGRSPMKLSPIPTPN